MNQQTERIIQHPIGEHNIPPLKIIQHLSGSLLHGSTRTTVGHRIIQNPCGQDSQWNQDADHAHHGTQRLTDTGVPMVPPLPHHPELTGDISHANGQNQIRGHHHIKHAEEIPRGKRRIENGTQCGRQDHPSQQNRPDPIAPGGPFGPEQEQHPPWDNGQGHHQEEPGCLGGIGNQMPLVPPDIPEHTPHRRESAQGRGGVGPKRPCIERIQQESGNEKERRSENDGPAELSPLKHRANHQQSGQRRKHPEGRKFRDSHPVNQSQRIQATRFPCALVFRKEPGSRQEQEQVEGPRKRTRG